MLTIHLARRCGTLFQDGDPRIKSQSETRCTQSVHFNDRCQIAYTTGGLDLGPVAHGLLDQSHIVQGCSGGCPARTSLHEGNSGFHGDQARPDNFII